MGLGTSLVLLAIGAILDFAGRVNTPGFNIHTVGVVLMVVGVLGILVSLLFWNSWGGVGNGAGGRRRGGGGKSPWTNPVGKGSRGGSGGGCPSRSELHRHQPQPTQRAICD